MTSRRIILAIEAAVAGGSLSLHDGNTEVAAWVGEDNSLRAESLVARISELLMSAEMDRHHLSAMVVSAGPGSFTGIRIGFATALGLKNSLDIPLSSVSVVEAMASQRNLTGIAAVPMGRDTACAQRFKDGGPIDEPFTTPVMALSGLDGEGTLLVHDSLARSVAGPRTTNYGRNLAAALAKMAYLRPEATTSPIFLSRTT
ncbi:MAG: tRNA (adenosine(37)-N6)-threonylcarbamoyltransferase complex dimerization subunit type 1 TsaB [Acidobacteria bacterium]|nr:tRNA (adenosine(37)-N6)-threonylcarbamoyltransferase complex dimerization subunit type 1 TsaB [Acidobacteriota bacterium]